MIDSSALNERLKMVRERVESALARAGREGEEITIIGVTKTRGPEIVDALIEAGISDIGENRIQEFLEKEPRVSGRCRWHMVGTLQRNKASKAIRRFELIQSVDSMKLAAALSRLSVDNGVSTRILVQVNTSEEPSKHGFEPIEVREAVAEIASLPGIALEGLMTIGPLTEDEGRIRRAFRGLCNLKESLNDELDLELRILSMGMSDDFEIAIEEGSTMIRLGRVLLGERS